MLIWHYQSHSIRCQENIFAVFFNNQYWITQIRDQLLLVIQMKSENVFLWFMKKPSLVEHFRIIESKQFFQIFAYKTNYLFFRMTFHSIFTVLQVLLPTDCSWRITFVAPECLFGVLQWMKKKRLNSMSLNAMSNRSLDKFFISPLNRDDCGLQPKPKGDRKDNMTVNVNHCSHNNSADKLGCWIIQVNEP